MDREQSLELMRSPEHWRLPLLPVIRKAYLRGNVDELGFMMNTIPDEKYTVFVGDPIEVIRNPDLIDSLTVYRYVSYEQLINSGWRVD